MNRNPMQRQGRGSIPTRSPSSQYRPSRPPRSLPQGYLQAGYFEKNSILKDRLICQDPVDIVKALTDPRLQDKPLEYSQIRKFFSAVRQMEYRLAGGEPWESVREDVLRLKVHAADAVNRQVAPRAFLEFMEKNVKEATKGVDAFLKGFVIHFESIIAFWPRRGGR